MDEEEPGGSGESFKDTREVPRADEPAEWKLNNWTFIEDQSVSRSGVLTESLIICEPNPSGKMVVGSQDQELVLHEIFPAVWKVRDKDEGKDGKGLHPRSNILDASPLFFGWEVSTRRPSNRS